MLTFQSALDTAEGLITFGHQFLYLRTRPIVLGDQPSEDDINSLLKLLEEMTKRLPAGFVLTCKENSPASNRRDNHSSV